MERDRELLTTDGLRLAVQEYHRQALPQAAPLPLAPTSKPTDTPKAQQAATDAYLELLMKKPCGELTAAEREFLRLHVAAVVRGL
jgi:hypothetical protein